MSTTTWTFEGLRQDWAPTLSTGFNTVAGATSGSILPNSAFSLEIADRTFITAPASTVATVQTTAAVKEPTVDDITSAPILWMQGRFVGSELPNRNGALWSSADLASGLGSVAGGPLNWLHESRHVIGSITSAEIITPSGELADAAEDTPTVPYIQAKAGIWRWIYPDEAYVIQQASDQQALWYSMECISKEVSCEGADGCGSKSTYSDYIAGASCEHVRQRASTRRFVDPVFLGGAVIVPPTRPGWAQADARVMNEAKAVAEAAFEDAGRPDIPASAWEQLMGFVIEYARTT